MRDWNYQSDMLQNGQNKNEYIGDYGAKFTSVRQNERIFAKHIVKKHSRKYALESKKDFYKKEVEPKIDCNNNQSKSPSKMTHEKHIGYSTFDKVLNYYYP